MSRQQFLHCALRKFRHSKSSVYRWYAQLDSRRFVCDTYKTMKATRTRDGWVHMFITHRPTLTLQLHNFDLFRTCRTALSRGNWRDFNRRHIARSLCGSWAACFTARTECQRQWMTTYYTIGCSDSCLSFLTQLFEFSVYWLLMRFNGCGLVVDSWLSWIHVSAIPHISMVVSKSCCDRLIGLYLMSWKIIA